MVMALSPEVTFRDQTMVEPAHDPAGHPGRRQPAGRQKACSVLFAGVVTSHPRHPNGAPGEGRPISRVLCPLRGDGHLSGIPVAGHLKRPTRGSPLPVWSVWVTPRRLFGLAPTGGCRATTVTGGAVGSYPTVSPLPVPLAGSGRSIFCGPVRRLAAPRCYLAVYPMELGLSSRGEPLATICPALPKTNLRPALPLQGQPLVPRKRARPARAS